MNLNQVTISVIDMNKSISFYQKLGLELIVHTHGDYARFFCPGGSTFSLHRTDDFKKGQSVVYFEVEDISSKYQELLQHGFNIESEPVDQSWLWTEFKILDPSGNELIIYHAGENRINPPWKIS